MRGGGGGGLDKPWRALLWPLRRTDQLCVSAIQTTATCRARAIPRPPASVHNQMVSASASPISMGPRTRAAAGISLRRRRRLQLSIFSPTQRGSAWINQAQQEWAPLGRHLVSFAPAARPRNGRERDRQRGMPSRTLSHLHARTRLLACKPNETMSIKVKLRLDARSHLSPSTCGALIHSSQLTLARRQIVGRPSKGEWRGMGRARVRAQVSVFHTLVWGLSSARLGPSGLEASVPPRERPLGPLIVGGGAQLVAGPLASRASAPPRRLNRRISNPQAAAAATDCWLA